jgi:hypothetical protein
MGRYEILATAALMMNMGSFFTLIQKVYITKNTSSFPWYYLFGNIISQILLITYGIINGAYGLYIPTLFLFAGLLYLVYAKLAYSDKIIVKSKRKENENQ